MKPVRHIALAFLLLCSQALAGEYGLTVDDRVSHGCANASAYSLNTCTSQLVVSDLKAHFIAGQPFQLAAIAPSLGSGRLSFRSSSERVLVCRTLADLLASNSLQTPEALERMVLATNYLAMYEALVAVRSSPHLSQVARERLDRILARHPKRPPP